MAKYKSADIRNLVLAGHAGAGKTMLADAMLLKAKAVTRLGSIADGTTTSDFEKEEKAYGYSLSPAVMRCGYAGREFNLVDTPGQTDFIAGMVGGLAAGDLALVCVNANRGIELMTRKAWEFADHYGLGKAVVITRMDGENVNAGEVLAGIRKTFGSRCVPFVIPDGEGSSFKGVQPVLAPGGDAKAKQAIVEAVAESNDLLMEKFLETMELSDAELMENLPAAIAGGAIFPVFYVASEKDMGVAELMDAIAGCGPSPLLSRRPVMKGEERAVVAPSENGPLLAHVFKVVSDPHVGRLSFLRVYSGKLEAKSQAAVSATGKPEKFNQLLRSQGDRREEVPDAIAGDIVCCAKVENLRVGDTVGAVDAWQFPPMPFPNPMSGLAVSPKSRGDEQKLGTNMHRLCEEDATFIFERNDLTKEQIIRGVGQVHLDVMLSKLKNRFNMEVETRPMKIPYLETITKPAEGSYRHKKQTGGAGQFAEVHLRLKPNERGKGFEFVDAIVGGVISGPFIPSVEKGVKKGMERGPVAGYPVVDAVVELFYGKEHPVDSKDIAFQIAGEFGFKEIVQNCKPVLLEPIVNLEVVFPAAYFGAISGDISTRRGRPTGTDQLGDLQVLKAQAPLAEVADYGNALKAITQGEGFYSMTLSHYEPAPGNIATQVAAKAKAAAEEK